VCVKYLCVCVKYLCVCVKYICVYICVFFYVYVNTYVYIYIYIYIYIYMNVMCVCQIHATACMSMHWMTHAKNNIVPCDGTCMCVIYFMHICIRIVTYMQIYIQIHTNYICANIHTNVYFEI